MTPERPQKFKVKESKVKVIAWHNVLAPNIVTFRERIAWLSLNIVFNYPNQLYMFKVTRSIFKSQ